MSSQSSKKFTLLVTALVLAITSAIIFSTGMGYITISAGEILKIILSAISNNPDLVDGIDATIPYVVMDVRLPRILTASLVGAGLAMSGVIYQGILLNPLADPYTLGISSGAAFGASLALLANITLFNQFSVPLFAFAGIWEVWKDAEERPIHSFSIITTSPNKLMEGIHDRMPVILPREDEEVWLRDQNPELLQKLLVPFDDAKMEVYSISKKVNSPRNNGPELVVPVAEESHALHLRAERRGARRA